MNKSESIKELCTALIVAKAEFNPIKKTALNPFFKSKYATLEMVIEATDPALCKNGLSIIQLVNGENLETVLIHTSGEWIASETALKAVKQDPQAQGSAITYARRYALSAILGVASEEDDDGNAGTKPTPPPKQLPLNPNISAQRLRAIDMIKASGHDIIQAQADYNKAKEAGACQEALDILQGHVDSLTDNN